MFDPELACEFLWKPSVNVAIIAMSNVAEVLFIFVKIKRVRTIPLTRKQKIKVSQCLGFIQNSDNRLRPYFIMPLSGKNASRTQL